MTEKDRSFIFNSWLKSYRDRNGKIRTDVYYTMQSEVIERLLNRSQVMLLVDPTDEDTIFGYIVCEPSKNTVHYVYVKYSLRQNLLAKAMVQAMLDVSKPMWITHEPHHMAEMTEKYQLIYNPFLKD